MSDKSDNRRSQVNSFEMEQWSDFVRGLVDPETEQRMRKVLSTSQDAQAKVDALRLVAELAAAERASAPPEWAVRCAKAFGSLRQHAQVGVDSSRVNSIWKRITMHLKFDSMTSPAPAGTRDAQADDRQLVFEIDDYRVDLRLEPETDFQHSVLVGQVLRSTDVVTPVADVPVLAVRRPSTSVAGPARDQVVASTRTSRFGEFQAGGLPASPLDLLLLLDDERCLELTLPGSTTDGHEFGESY